MQWFRFYGEAVSDPKVRRIARETKQPVAAVLGVWVTLLSVASDSPERGTLLLGTSPATVEDLSDLAGMNVAPILGGMRGVGMVDWDDDGLFFIPNWDKRQFASDNVTERVRKSRAKRSEGEEVKRFRNVAPPDTCNTPEADTETEQKQSIAEPQPAAAAAASGLSPDPDYAKWVKQYEYKAGTLVPSAYHADLLKGWMKEITYEGWEYVLEQAAKKGQAKNWSYVESIVHRIAKDGLPMEAQVKAAAQPQRVSSGIAALLQ